MYWQSNRWKGLTVALLMMILGSGVAWSQDDESIENQLGLTQQQKEQISTLRENFKKDTAPIKGRINALQTERKQLEKDGASEAEVKEVLKKIANEEISLTLLLNKFKKNYLAVLTPEQRKKLQEMKNR